jgi:GTP-binding protein HflX
VNKAILVCIDFRDSCFEESVEEIKLLVTSAGVKTLDILFGKRDRPDAAFYAGKGKIQELAELVSDTGADLVVFNHAISPVQQRNIERSVKCRTLDRTSLILDIFAQRARTHEGKVQVELAQLNHLSTRLIRGWTHLERQKGGIGLRGPGETQLETDRRLLGFRVKSLKSKLAVIEKQRKTRRRNRNRRGVLKISLVGYTNAGKSSLFNRLTKAKALAANQLFATLDTTTRKLAYVNQTELVMSDTVGFVRDLPHSLVEAFKATLEETAESDILFHVIDASSRSAEFEMEQVRTVLREIGAEGVPQICIFNKIDLTDLKPGIERLPCGNIKRVNLSALTGEGIEQFRELFPELLLSTDKEKSTERSVSVLDQRVS